MSLKKIDQEKYFDSILNTKIKRGVCHQCGELQTHMLRWCKHCGGEFCHHDHTLLESIKIRDRFYANICKFYAAVYQRKIRAMGFNEKDFENYTENLIK